MQQITNWNIHDFLSTLNIKILKNYQSTLLFELLSSYIKGTVQKLDIDNYGELSLYQIVSLIYGSTIAIAAEQDVLRLELLSSVSLLGTNLINLEQIVYTEFSNENNSHSENIKRYDSAYYEKDRNEYLMVKQITHEDDYTLDVIAEAPESGKKALLDQLLFAAGLVEYDFSNFPDVTIISTEFDPTDEVEYAIDMMEVSLALSRNFIMTTEIYSHLSFITTDHLSSLLASEVGVWTDLFLLYVLSQRFIDNSFLNVSAAGPTSIKMRQ